MRPLHRNKVGGDTRATAEKLAIQARPARIPGRRSNRRLGGRGGRNASASTASVQAARQGHGQNAMRWDQYVAWLTLALSGRWASDRGWPDRLGRLLGSCWMGLAVLRLLASWLWLVT